MECERLYQVHDRLNEVRSRLMDGGIELLPMRDLAMMSIELRGQSTYITHAADAVNAVRRAIDREFIRRTPEEQVSISNFNPERSK